MPTYDRPVEATLHIHLANGEEFEATPDDLKKFGYVDRLSAYMKYNRHVDKVLRDAGLLENNQDLTDTKLNPLRYITEIAINYPELLTHPDMDEVNQEIIALEVALRKAALVETEQEFQA